MNFSEATHDTPGISFKNLMVSFLFFHSMGKDKIQFKN